MLGSRQKLKLRICDGDPEIADCFQISVNILEMKNLARPKTGEIFVVVSLGDEKRKITLNRRNGENCREYLLFEWYTSLEILQNSNLNIVVMEPQNCASPKLLGRATLGLGVIWAEPNHQINQKWVPLCLPKKLTVNTVGFLKLDISVMARSVNISKMSWNAGLESSNLQTANYVVYLYNAFGVVPRLQPSRPGKLPSTYVKVTYCGISVQTSVRVRSNNPAYNERLCITNVFPNTCQTVRFEVCTTEQSLDSVLASVDLNLDHISYEGENGFVPTFGPSLLHMCGASILGTELSCEGPFYKGTLFVAFKTFVPYLHQGIRTTVEPIIPLQMENLFSWNDFCIYCAVFEVSMLDRQFVSKECGVAFTAGEIPCKASASEEKRKLHYTGPIQIPKTKEHYAHINFGNAYPILQHAARLPDFRFRIYRHNFMEKIHENLRTKLSDVEYKFNNYAYSTPSELLEELNIAVNTASDQILKIYDYIERLEPTSFQDHYVSELDEKQMYLLKQQLEKVYREIREEIDLNSAINLMKRISKTSTECYSVSKKHVKALLAESLNFAVKLKALVFKSPHGWPEIIFWLLCEGSRVAYHKISTDSVIFSDIPELCGKDCGHIQTVYLKPLKCAQHPNALPNTCDCIASKVELLFWGGLYSEIACFDGCFPQGLRVKTREYDMCLKAPVIMVRVRVFIYRAKLKLFENVTHPSSFVRINVLSCVRETRIQEFTSTPVWDQVLTVTKMMKSSQERIISSPPELLVEMMNYEKTTNSKLLGRFTILPVVTTTPSIDCTPLLKWHNIILGNEDIGQILIAASIQTLPETIVKSTIYTSVNEVSEVTYEVNDDAEKDIIENIPRSLKPKLTAYKIDVYWWGIRDFNAGIKPCAVLEMDNLTINSDVISDTKSNCNFPNGRTSHTFEGNLESSLSFKICVNGSFGRNIFVGLCAVKSPSKFLVDWIPKTDRNLLLKTASIYSSDFIKVNETLYIKKQSYFTTISKESNKDQISVTNSKINRKWSWQRFFCKSEPDEEKYVLLPVHTEKKNVIDNVISETEPMDWWSRFFASQEDDDRANCRKIKIYHSELEKQVEFSKFKDWCKSVKLCNGRKRIGKPEEDKEKLSGSMKVGVAIYRWPPPSHIVPVDWSGIELDKGYFHNFPNNNPAEFLVRVYIVRGLNLSPKHVNGTCHSYVVVKCGDKQYGERSDYKENSVNPVFGRLFEFKCSLPEEYLMNVSVYNYDRDDQNSVIGVTNIDIENRIYSKHRGLVGLSSEYRVTGPFKWRDYEKPSNILNKICLRHHIEPPSFPDWNTVILNGVEYRESDNSVLSYISATERRENLCLSILRKWHTLPQVGYHLVPEHVEMRTLYDLDKPDLEQGKLQMWVDIFPLDTGVFTPLPVDITPRKVEEYELRVIIWNVSLVSKKTMDLYVKAWLGNVEQTHYTDVHYNSTRGEACFNWRMIFNFRYQSADNKLLTTERGPFTEYEERIPPVLIVQVVDSNVDSIDDFLGFLTLDLSAVPRGSRQVLSTSDVDKFKEGRKINLFNKNSIRYWWPLHSVEKESGEFRFEGLIDIELHILRKEKARMLPAGLGRESPNPLPMPNRYVSMKRATSSFDRMFQRAKVEYVIIGVLFTLLITLLFWKFHQPLDEYGFYYS